MKKTLYTILISGLILGASLSATSKAFADCQPVYGGGQTCTSNTFTIQKFVQVPGKGGGNYVNNLFNNDPKYFSSQKISFKILVQNTGSQNISTLNVVDTLPEFINFVSGPGSFDSNTKTLSFTINNLGAGQTVTYFVDGKISDASVLPSDQGIVCRTNLVKATDNTGVTGDSSSSFCIQNNVLPLVAPAPKIVSTPATGPEMLPLLSLIPGGLAGFILRKKSLNK